MLTSRAGEEKQRRRLVHLHHDLQILNSDLAGTTPTASGVRSGADLGPTKRLEVDLALVLGIARLPLNPVNLEEVVDCGHESPPSSSLRGAPQAPGSTLPRMRHALKHCNQRPRPAGFRTCLLGHTTFRVSRPPRPGIFDVVPGLCVGNLMKLGGQLSNLPESLQTLLGQPSLTAWSQH